MAKISWDEQSYANALDNSGGLPSATAAAPSSAGGGVLSKSMGVLSKITDLLSRGNYASANIANNLVDKNYNIADAAKAGWAGITGKTKGTYADVLNNAGVKNKYVKAVGGFAGDVLLDPTTWITLGSGAGAKILSKSGTTVLTKAGSKELVEMTAKMGKEAAEKSMMKILAKDAAKAAKYLDKGGIKFAGKTIAGTAGLNAALNPANKAVSLAVKPIEKIAAKALTPVVKAAASITKPLTDVLLKAFDRDALIRNNPIVKRIVQNAGDKTQGRITRIIDESKTVFNGVSRESKEKIGLAFWKKDPSILSVEEKKLYDYAVTKFETNYAEESARNLIKGKVDDFYVPQMYRNREEARAFFGVDKDQLNVLNRYGKKRTIKSYEQALHFGLEPETDIEKLLNARLTEGAKSIERHDMIKNIADETGIPSKIMTEKTLKNGKTKMVEIVNPELSGSTSPMTKIGDVVGLDKSDTLKEVAIPTRIAQYIQNMDKAILKDENIRGAIKYYDQFTNWFKGSVTTKFPAFNFRNAVSNVLQNWLDIGLLNSINPKFHASAIKIMDGKLVDDIVKIGGKEYTVGEIRKIMQDTGVLQGIGFFDVKKDLNATTKLGKLNEAPNKAARFIENEARAVNFLANLETYGDVATASERTKKFLFDYNNLSSIEKSGLKRIAPFYCVPDYSEILTRDGWKFYSELQQGEEALTYNISTRKTEWQKIKEVAVFDFDGELSTLESRGTEFVFTDDHRWPVITKRTFAKGKWYGDETKIIRAYELNKSHRIPLAAPSFQTGSLLSEYDSQLLGWIVTDGYHRYRGNCLEAMIYQHPKKHADKIREMFRAIISSESVHPDTGVICFRIKTSALSTIKKYFKSKEDLPSIVTRLGSVELAAMYEAMMDAEGHRGLKGFQFVQRAGGVMDAFQIICNLLGKAFQIKIHRTNGCSYGYVKNHTVIDINGWSRKKKKYSGKIWCPKTENSTWIMRQNGKVIITGNTWTSKNFGLYAEQMLKNPGKIAEQIKAFRAIENTGDPISAEERAAMPDYMQNSFMRKSVNKKTGKTEYQSGIGAPLEGFASLIANPTGNIKFSLNPGIKAVFTALTKTDIDAMKPVAELNYKNARALKVLPSAIRDRLGFTENQMKDGTKQYTANPFALYVLRQPPFSRVTTSANTLSGDNLGSGLQQFFTGTRVDEEKMDSWLKQREGEYKKGLATPLVNKGWIKDNGYGKYYRNKSIQLSPEDIKSINAVLTELNTENVVTVKKSSAGSSITPKPVTKISNATIKK